MCWVDAAGPQAKGFFGFEIAPNRFGEKRKLYARSDLERTAWLEALKAASSGSNKFDDAYEMLEPLGKGEGPRRPAWPIPLCGAELRGHEWSRGALG